MVTKNYHDDLINANNGDSNECRSKHNKICYQSKDSN